MSAVPGRQIKSCFPPKGGRTALSANERIAKFLHFAIQAKFAHVNRLRAADVSAVPALHGLLAAALIRAAHALVALSGMTVAVGADVDCAQVTAVLRVVMTAGRNGTVNGLIFHEKSLQIKILSGFARSIVWRERRKLCFCEKRRIVPASYKHGGIRAEIRNGITRKRFSLPSLAENDII